MIYHGDTEDTEDTEKGGKTIYPQITQITQMGMCSQRVSGKQTGAFPIPGLPRLGMSCTRRQPQTVQLARKNLR